MGGVDRMDENTSHYRIAVRPKKWWIPFFMFMPDAAVQNAWLLHRSSSNSDNEPMDLLSFGREIVNIYRMKYSSPQRSHIFSPTDIVLSRGKSNDKRVPSEVRFDAIRHYPLSNPTQRRCSYCGKKSKCICSKCSIGLHIDCFENYHEYVNQ